MNTVPEVSSLELLIALAQESKDLGSIVITGSAFRSSSFGSPLERTWRFSGIDGDTQAGGQRVYPKTAELLRPWLNQHVLEAMIPFRLLLRLDSHDICFPSFQSYDGAQPHRHLQIADGQFVPAPSSCDQDWQRYLR